MVVGHLGNGIGVPGAPHGQSPPIGGVPVSGNRCSVLRSPSQRPERILAGIPELVGALGVGLARRSPKANADYSNGYTLTDIAEVLKEVVRKEEHVSAATARLRLCQDVGLATIRERVASTWPGGMPSRNHAKLVAVDDRAFYIGSENLYPARLQELGLIVEDQKAAHELKTAYLDPLWRYSGPYGLIDPPHRCRSF